MNQYLIAVTLKARQGKIPVTTERTIYRVADDALLGEVILRAKQRSEMVGKIYCTNLEVLGELEPHLWDEYPDLLGEGDTTDATGAPTNDGVFCIKEGMFKVYFNGRVCGPEWTQRGPAQAYLDLLQKGVRKPEYRK